MMVMVPTTTKVGEHSVVAIAATNGTLYALRSDGAVFVLVKRKPVTDKDPYWAPCPAVPGTDAAIAQEG